MCSFGTTTYKIHSTIKLYAKIFKTLCSLSQKTVCLCECEWIISKYIWKNFKVFYNSQKLSYPVQSARKSLNTEVKKRKNTRTNRMQIFIRISYSIANTKVESQYCFGHFYNETLDKSTQVPIKKLTADNRLKLDGKILDERIHWNVIPGQKDFIDNRAEIRDATFDVYK